MVNPCEENGQRQINKTCSSLETEGTQRPHKENGFAAAAFHVGY
jgi:hypothetical protein